jgi:hypothetical protein
VPTLLRCWDYHFLSSGAALFGLYFKIMLVLYICYEDSY